MWADFKKFVTRGNLIDLAVAVVIGTAFASVTKSLVDDIIMPPLGLLTGDIDFANMYVLLAEGDPAGPYNTLKAAQEAGAIAISYGNFITVMVNFVVVAAAMFGVIRFYQKADKTFFGQDEQPPEPRKCPYCITEIADEATRCPHCTSQLDATDE